MTFLFDSVRTASKFASRMVRESYCENVATTGCLVTLVNVFDDSKDECVAEVREFGGFSIDPRRLYDVVASVETAIDSIDEGQSPEAVASYLNVQMRHCFKGLRGASL